MSKFKLYIIFQYLVSYLYTINKYRLWLHTYIQTKVPTYSYLHTYISI